MFTVLIDVAGSVQRLHGGLVSGASGLVLAFGSQAIDLKGGVRAKSKLSVNDQPGYLNHISARLNRQKAFSNHLPVSTKPCCA